MKIKMKKVLCALFAIILVCTGLSACGKSQCYAKITYSDGSSKMLDKKDMEELFSLRRLLAYSIFPFWSMEHQLEHLTGLFTYPSTSISLLFLTCVREL